MKLYKIAAANYEDYYGTMENPIDRSYTTTIAQKPDCSAFLFLCRFLEITFNAKLIWNNFKYDPPDRIYGKP